MAAATTRRKSAGMLLSIVTALELQEMALLIRPSRQRRPYASENAHSRTCDPPLSPGAANIALLGTTDSRDLITALSEIGHDAEPS
jgi:hypothetical protein